MHSKIRTYSKGMKQRLGIAQALLHDPEVIFLDEPTDGVDPLGRREIRELMGRLKEKGHTIFLNSHLLGEVELICDRVAILQRGQLVREGTIDELTKQKGRVRDRPGSRASSSREREANALGYASRSSRRPTSRRAPPPPELWEVGLTDGQTIDRLIRLIFEKGLNLRHLIEQKQSLEDVFLATVEGAEPGVDKKPTGKAIGRGRERPMTQFFAILKDSFREAVDGFVIYAMLGMSLLVIVIVGSMSFKPAEPPDAFNKIVSAREFTTVFSDRGRSRAMGIGSFDSNKFSASDVQPSGSGYKLRVTVTVAARIAGTVNRQTGHVQGRFVPPDCRVLGQATGSDDQGEGHRRRSRARSAEKVPDVEINLDQNATPGGAEGGDGRRHGGVHQEPVLAHGRDGCHRDARSRPESRNRLTRST